MYYGDFAEDDTVQILFNTFTSDDPSASCTITNLVAGDIKIHKDGGVDQKASADGVTVSVNFDGITGNHLVSIDTSDDTGAAGFWVTGSEYQVRMEGTTVDGATINAWIGAFSIERAGGTIALLKLIQVATITNAAGADIATDIKAVKAETVLIVEDTGELQTDDIPGTLATIAGYLDTEIAAIVAAVITNAAGVDIAADIIALKAETALIVADTNELQGDDYPADLTQIMADLGGAIELIVDLNNLSAANVNAEVADVLKTDTLTEPAQGAPGVNISMEAKIAWLYKFMRNKITNDGTDIKVYNDAEAVVDHKAPVAEAAGTVTRGEFVTGP